jgi:Flp pilus assembly protein TadB
VPIITSDGVIGALSLAYFSVAIRMHEAVAKFTHQLKEAADAIADDLRHGRVTVRDAPGVTAVPDVLN